MKQPRSIRYKAAFLLTVFALNTLVGFACAMGVDMGFNSSHHGQQEKGEMHIHKDGKKHLHKPGAGKHHNNSKQATSKTDGCCKGKVVKLQTADKTLQYSQPIIAVPEFTVSAFFQPAIFPPVKGVLQKYIDYYFHPPPHDIRVSIQSFQI